MSSNLTFLQLLGILLQNLALMSHSSSTCLLVSIADAAPVSPELILKQEEEEYQHLFFNIENQIHNQQVRSQDKHCYWMAL